jgi:hypothetical protein
MPTTRLNTEERAAARRYATELAKRYRDDPVPPEPALGTLEQRLRILVVRHGGRVKVASPTPAERALVEVG